MPCLLVSIILRETTYFNCTGDLRGGDAAGNSTDDKKGKEYRKVLCWRQKYRMDCISAKHSCYMDLGASVVYINGECLYKGFCRTLLVSGAECTMSDTVYSFLQKDKGRNTRGITLSGYMYGKYRSKAVRNIYLFQLGTLSTLSTGVQLLAGSKILSV